MEGCLLSRPLSDAWGAPGPGPEGLSGPARRGRGQGAQTVCVCTRRLFAVPWGLAACVRPASRHRRPEASVGHCGLDGASYLGGEWP